MKKYFVNQTELMIDKGNMWLKMNEDEEEKEEEEIKELPKAKKVNKSVSDDVIRLMIKEVESGRNVHDVCKEYQISDMTFYGRRKKLQKKEGNQVIVNGEKKEPIKWDYESSCGYRFTSVISPKEVKCPDCGDSCKVLKEYYKEF